MDGNKFIHPKYFIISILLSTGTIPSTAQAITKAHKHSVQGTNATTVDLCRGFLPPNELRIPAGREIINGSMTEDQFNKVISKVETLYSPRVAHYGGTLTVRREWQNSEVNAYAQREGSNFVVKMFGGLARHPAMTPDGFTLVLCHEIGHHIGGVPRYTAQGGQWASVEGQADYFANLKCMRHVFLNEDNEAFLKDKVVPQEARTLCEKNFNQKIDQLICMRGALASLTAGEVFAQLSGSQIPTLSNRDPQTVAQTFEKHPQPQCRVDTYFAAALCSVDEEVEIGQNDARVGVCNRTSGQELEARPLCWYKDTSGGGGGTNPPTGDRPLSPTVQGQSSITVTRPENTIPISIDVRNVPGAAGFLIEASKPNQVFTNPDGNTPDPVGGLGYEGYRGTFGTYSLVPIRKLPGYGTYQFRILGLDQNGRPVGKFSQVLIINLR